MKIAIALLIVLPLSSAALGTPQKAPAKSASSEQELVNEEAAWAKAMVARDGAVLNHIMAADWHGQDHSGKWVDRKTVVDAYVNGTDKISAMANHDLHVKFVGNDVAIVQGMDNETSAYKGKSTSGTYSWTDVYQKRGGQWVAIASQVTKVK